MQFIGPSAVSFPPWISSQAFPSQSPLHCRKPFLNLLQLWPHNPSIHHHPPPKRKVKGPKILCEFLLHKLLQWSRSHGSGPIGTKATGLSQGKYQLLNFIKFEITALFFKTWKNTFIYSKYVPCAFIYWDNTLHKIMHSYHHRDIPSNSNRSNGIQEIVCLAQLAGPASSPCSV